MDHYPPAVQRPALLKFLTSIGARDTALRRDDCGDWHISGAKGCIYATRDGFQFYVKCERPDGEPALQAWTYAKRGLSFARLRNDGENEGMFILARLPTDFEAIAIRQYLGIAKKRDISPEELIRLRALSTVHGFAKAA